MMLLVSEQFLNDWLLERERSLQGSHQRTGVRNHAEALPIVGLRVSEVLSTCQVGADPFSPGLAAHGLKHWLDQLRSEQGEPHQVELMESFAAQTILNVRALGFAADTLNTRGGLLAMGHPVGASGAVLAARLHHGLGANEWGLAIIPAAGGIASGLALRRVSPA
jgi:acetyl-CoA C-acetyltransferase